MDCGGVQAEGFPALQEVAGVELRLETIPVSSPDQAARYLAQMVRPYPKLSICNQLILQIMCR